uniref:Uncharacterized protein n=1 Tax=Zea mays TaxID=4577 RepID=C0PNG0_MAIZE|nr:unknown [Zea mays]
MSLYLTIAEACHQGHLRLAGEEDAPAATGSSSIAVIWWSGKRASHRCDLESPRSSSWCKQNIIKRAIFCILGCFNQEIFQSMSINSSCSDNGRSTMSNLLIERSLPLNFFSSSLTSLTWIFLKALRRRYGTWMTTAFLLPVTSIWIALLMYRSLRSLLSSWATESSNSEGSRPFSFWIFFLAVYILPSLRRRTHRTRGQIDGGAAEVS